MFNLDETSFENNPEVVDYLFNEGLNDIVGGYPNVNFNYFRAFNVSEEERHDELSSYDESYLSQLMLETSLESRIQAGRIMNLKYQVMGKHTTEGYLEMSQRVQIGSVSNQLGILDIFSIKDLHSISASQSVVDVTLVTKKVFELGRALNITFKASSLYIDESSDIEFCHRYLPISGQKVYGIRTLFSIYLKRIG